MNQPEILQALLDLLPDVVYFQDTEGRYRVANEAAAANLGLSLDELIGQTTEEVFSDRDTIEMMDRNREKILESGDPRTVEEELVLPSGEKRVYEARSVFIDEEEFGIPGVAGIVRDVTDRRQTERDLARTKQKYEAVFELNPVSLMVVDGETDRVLEVNQAFEKLYGLDRKEVAGKKPAELDVFIDPGEIDDLGARAMADDEIQEAVIRIRRQSGEVRDVLLACVSLTSDDERYLIAAGQDVSPFVEAEQALRRRAFHDALTGLPNRDLLWDRCLHALERAERTGERLGVLFIDLDGLKAVNDTYGHAAGDTVLTAVADRLTDATRSEDTVSRLGGDEFVVLLEDADDMRTVARRIMKAIAEPVRLSQATTRPSASLGGVEVVPSKLGSADGKISAERVDAILRRADQAMYAAKVDKDTSGRFVTYP